MVNQLLDKQYGANKLPNGESDIAVSNDLKDFFHNKVKGIYDKIQKDAASLSGQPTVINDPNYNSNSLSGGFIGFSEMSSSSVSEIIKSMSTKSCSLDPLPMWMFKNCLDEVLPIVTYIVNKSLKDGQFPDSLKHALVRPSLKKPNLDSDDHKNYRPVSNLTYMSKIIEKCVHQQLTQYITANDMFAKFQSGYRKGHSCETAITKIHNDILLQVDSKSHVVLMLLDLSAAFDTINHSVLLKRLKNYYNIQGTAYNWIKSYLSNRTFKVIVNNSVSDSAVLEIGVPQGSILGPLLFILYTKDLEEIATKYGFYVHLYADDTQIYFSFDPKVTDSHHVDRLADCFKDIKQWMTQNFLKLNDDKTEILVLKHRHSPYDPIHNFFLDNVNITATKTAKNLGFLFDSSLTLEKHINNVSRTCYMNLRNLGRIGSKLSEPLKIQLVHSCVHSFIDNYNSVFGALSEVNLHKLQKIQNNGVRFIFGIYGKNKRQSITPYLQKLHFLPVRYRIKYKICTTVFKCINNLAPKYLSDMVSIRNPNNHQLRLDDDFFKKRQKSRKDKNLFIIIYSTQINIIKYIL